MLKRSDPHSSAKALIAFLIVVVAFSVLFIFERNKDNILYTGNFQSFIFLVFLGSSLLLTLLFLVNKSIESKVVRKTKSKKRRRSST